MITAHQTLNALASATLDEKRRAVAIQHPGQIYDLKRPHVPITRPLMGGEVSSVTGGYPRQRLK